MGLGASVWASDVQRANEIAKKIEAGNVWVNVSLSRRVFAHVRWCQGRMILTSDADTLRARPPRTLRWPQAQRSWT